MYSAVAPSLEMLVERHVADGGLWAELQVGGQGFAWVDDPTSYGTHRWGWASEHVGDYIDLEARPRTTDVPVDRVIKGFGSGQGVRWLPKRSCADNLGLKAHHVVIYEGRGRKRPVHALSLHRHLSMPTITRKQVSPLPDLPGSLEPSNCACQLTHLSSLFDTLITALEQSLELLSTVYLSSNNIF